MINEDILVFLRLTLHITLVFSFYSILIIQTHCFGAGFISFAAGLQHFFTCILIKLFSLQLLLSKGVKIPTTGFASSPLDTNDLIEMVGGSPLIVKLLEGTKGKGVVLAETKKAAESVINAFKSLKANILVQEFIKEADGKDIRCFVIDGKVVASMQRTAPPGEFRANVHLGGSTALIKATAEERKLAIKATKAMGLSVAGVDIIRSSGGPLVLGVNSYPGLEGIEAATQKDIAQMMIKSIEKKCNYVATIEKNISINN